MTQEPEILEAEVVEIDGVAPTPRPEPAESRREWQDWRSWQGRARSLDARWWPLWIILGIIAVVLVLTLGVVIGAALLAIRAVAAIVRGLFALMVPSSNGVVRR